MSARCSRRGRLHGGRSAFNHLLYLAQTQGVPRKRVSEVLELVGLSAVAASAPAASRSAWASGSASRRRCSAIREILILDEPVNGLDPEGVLWIRQLLKALAADGRTIFVSSHLMNEMAVTADHLIVIGRGKLQADMPVGQFIAQFSDTAVLVRTPDVESFRAEADARGWDVTSTDQDGALIVTGSTAPQIGEARGRARPGAARAHAAEGLAGRGVHGAHPGVRRVRTPARNRPRRYRWPRVTVF